MSTTTTTHNAEPGVTSDARLTEAAVRLYDAEHTLHVARQTHEDPWINHAADRLHERVVEYLQALGDNPAPDATP